jgi:nitroimidazol reductase NimA-like FMN-containing flavoprotein (pyridoxamine 5'-phosphate oxidase superfamily)
MDHIEYAYTSGMDEETVESRLREAATGVLGLATDEEAYALPMAHHYDDGVLYFRWGVREESMKMEYLEGTQQATYVVYDVEPTGDARGLASWSILARGPIRPLPQAETAPFDTATLNEAFAPIRVFDESIQEVDIRVVELRVESLTGRETRPA